MTSRMNTADQSMNTPSTIMMPKGIMHSNIMALLGIVMLLAGGLSDKSSGEGLTLILGSFGNSDDTQKPPRAIIGKTTT